MIRAPLFMDDSTASDDGPVAEAGGAPSWAPGYARVHADLPPLSFQFRASPEDFIVEEIAAEVESPDPTGTHIWFTVEKRDVSTPEAARRIARALDRHPADVSFAGRKDAVAVTRQRMSIEHVDIDVLLALDLDKIRIRDPLRCLRKIRLGQQAGNRFHLRLSGVAEADHEELVRQVDALGRDGVPNYYGAQRFGADGKGLALGRALVQAEPIEYLELLSQAVPRRTREAARELLRRIREGTTSERRRATELCGNLDDDFRPVAQTLARRRPDDVAVLVRSVPKRSRSFHLAILQARVFNRILAERVRAGTSATVLEGDVVRRPDGRHVVTEVGGCEGVPTGPLWSADVLVAEGPPGEIERAALTAEGLRPEELANPGGLTPRGARRPLTARFGNAEVGPWTDGSVWIAFDLPVGSYATIAMAELTGIPDVAADH